jgi:hypothetical protein
LAWAEQWSIKVDGNEVNTIGQGGYLSTQVPEVGWDNEVEVVWQSRDNTYPVAVALRPTAGNLTFLIQMKPCTWATWESQLTTLRMWFTTGPHLFTFQIRGMPAPLSMAGIVKGMQTSPKERRLVVSAVVPNPVLA